MYINLYINMNKILLLSLPIVIPCDANEGIQSFPLLTSPSVSNGFIKTHKCPAPSKVGYQLQGLCPSECVGHIDLHFDWN